VIGRRIGRFAEIVGRERVIPGTDCGFGTFAGFGMVDPDVAWMKLAALSQGAAEATERLWSPRAVTA
jgi:5-methyltetrahydropteroyltriglutamate--homocysteine methyltransferase